MQLDHSRVIPIIKAYLDNGWRVDYFEEKIKNEYQIISPSGSVFGNYDLTHWICPFCNQNNPQWDEDWCNHSDELLDEESEARNLWNFLRLVPELQERNLP